MKLNEKYEKVLSKDGYFCGFLCNYCNQFYAYKEAIPPGAPDEKRHIKHLERSVRLCSCGLWDEEGSDEY